jgi:hypothetical protein
LRVVRSEQETIVPSDPHPAATPHVPSFAPLADGSDYLLSFMTVSLVISVLAVGLLFLRIHTLPERMAHRSKKIQFELVAVLGLLALFTHEHAFWVAGLLLAFINVPDFATPMLRAVRALETLADIPPPREEQEPQPAPEDVQYIIEVAVEGTAPAPREKPHA